MKQFTYVFYGYSPYHALFFANYINTLEESAEIMITGPEVFLEKIKNSFKNGNFANGKVTFLRLPNTATNLSLFQRIFGRVVIYLKLRNVKCIGLYSANELAFPSIVLERNSKCESGILLDEGFLQGAVRKESAMLRYTFKHLMRVLLNFSSKKRFDNVVFKILYTRDMKFFENYIIDSTFEIRDATPFTISEKAVTLRDHFETETTVFLLTSPLTENNNSKYPGQEIDLLENLVKRNSHKRFLLKPHYREDYFTKYERLRQLQNFGVMSGRFLNFSSQDLDFSGFSVVGFHSSALIDIARTGKTDVFSLSKLVGSQHSTSVLPALTDLIMITEDLKLE